MPAAKLVKLKLPVPLLTTVPKPVELQAPEPRRTVTPLNPTSDPFMLPSPLLSLKTVPEMVALAGTGVFVGGAFVALGGFAVGGMGVNVGGKLCTVALGKAVLGRILPGPPF